MGAEAAAAERWGTWEELVLGGAVVRHGTGDWNVVASELRARTVNPYSVTPEACKTKYEDLQKRYSGSTAWFEELRKRRVAELKRELARSEDSIGSLESKIRSLEARNRNSSQADVSSQIGSPLPLLNSDGTGSLGKETPKDEQSAGSFTEDSRTRRSWSCKRRHPPLMTNIKHEPSFSSEHGEDLGTKKMPETGFEQLVIIRKRRGQRRRKNSSLSVKDVSVEESDNLGSSNVASTTKKDTSIDDCSQRTRDSGTVNRNGSSCNIKREKLMGNGSSSNIKRENLMEIFTSIADTESAGVFKHRMDSQKRARYRKIIRQHLDMGNIRSRIIGESVISAKELFRDLLLLANNALVFYSRRTREYKSALSLRRLVMKEYKQHCSGICHEATSAFSIPCNPPVKPRSARPRPCPRPPPCKDKVSQKLCDAENVDSKIKVSEKLCDAEKDVCVASEKPLKKLSGVAPEKALKKLSGVAPEKALKKLSGVASEKALKKQSGVAPEKALKKLSDSEMPLQSLLKVKKGMKRPGKVKPELADKRRKISPVKQRKKVRK